MEQHHPLEAQAKEEFIDTPPIDIDIEKEDWRKAPPETRLLIWQHYNSRPPFDVLLTTESPHPKTMNLSQLAQTDLEAAYKILREVDLDALKQLSQHQTAIEELSEVCFDTLFAGASIRMSGCGSAARAALVAEKLFRELFPNFARQVSTIPAGGDVVVIRAAEGFEDRADYGVRQLQDSGWCEKDLFIGASASGASAFVHGELKHVIAHPTARQPIFLICNSIEECLHSFSQDEKTIFSQINALEKIKILAMPVGPMALAGSTRMQAATVQLFALGFALLKAGQRLTGQELFDVSDLIGSLCTSLEQMPISTLADLTKRESQAYVSGHDVIYKVSPENALTIATDTTERSPTFNQNYFENRQEASPPSLCRIALNGITENEQALKALLGREIRPLDWDGEPKTTRKFLLGYSLTEDIIKSRRDPVMIDIEPILELCQTQKVLPKAFHSLHQQLLLKMILNTHSTLVAGQMGWYQNNLMFFVRPGNLKLLGRAAGLAYNALRKVSFFERRLPKESITRITKSQVLETLYRIMIAYRPGESVVLSTYDAVLREQERLCYAYFLMLTKKQKRLEISPKKEKEDPPFITDLNIAHSITQGQKPVLCIEGGGTYFRVSLISAHAHQPYLLQNNVTQEEAHTLKFPSGNCNSIGWDKFETLLHSALSGILIEGKPLLSFIKNYQPIIAAGITGMASEVNRQKLIAYFSTLVPRKHIVAMGDVDVYLSSLPGYGTVLIAGTGSVCFGLSSFGERIQAGGFGAALSGDPGSAFSVGKHLTLAYLNLREGARVYDEHTKKFISKTDPLYESALKKLTELFPNVRQDEWIVYLNLEHKERVKFAELAPLVFEYEERSPLAQSIIFNTAKELATQLAEAVESILSQDIALKTKPFSVILVGGLFDEKHGQIFKDKLSMAFSNIFPGLAIDWRHDPSENYVVRVAQNGGLRECPERVLSQKVERRSKMDNFGRTYAASP